MKPEPRRHGFWALFKKQEYLMKSGFVILLAGLFILCLMPVQGVANQTTAVNFPVELSYDNFDQEKPAGPCRDDFGPDWIFYDDERPDLLLWTGENYWSRVTFTPNARFELRGARFMPLNEHNRPGECHVMVFTEDQDTGDLDEELIDFVIDRLPAWAGFPDSWEDVEFDDEDFHTFEGGEHFSILYGPAPGGNYQQGENGWWNLSDTGTDVYRSFLAVSDNPPMSHRTWENVDYNHDLLIRANGEYLEDFIDLAVVGLFNNTEKWLMYPETEVIFTARIENLGGEVDFPYVTFNFYDDEGNAIWEEPYEVIIESIAEEAVIEVPCETIWTTEEIGDYFVEVIVTADDDSNPENDIMSMEQICINPADWEDAEMWVGYCSDQPTSRISGQDSTGWGVAWGHPGGNEPLWVTAFAQYLQEEDGNPVDCHFGLAVFTPADRRADWVWIGTVELPPNNAIWLEMELDQDEIEATSFNSDQEIWLCYMNSGPTIQIDSRAPVSGQNPDMPPTNLSFDGWDGGAGDTGSGDHMARVKLGISDIILPGKLLRIEPEVLDFGEVSVGVEHRIEATFTSYGDEPVTIREFQIAGSCADYVSLDPDEEFVIEPQSEQIVTITFYTGEPIELDSRIRVHNDSDNLSQFFMWYVLANAQSVDDANRPVMPENYALYQNYPNPFNPTTSIEFALRSAGDVKLNVFDMNGRLVKEVVNNHLDAGYHTVEIDASDLAAGIYLYRLTTGDFTNTRKMILMK